MNTCLRDLPYAKKIYIAFAGAYARLRGLWNIRSTAYAAIIRSSLEYMRLVIEKKTMLNSTFQSN